MRESPVPSGAGLSSFGGSGGRASRHVLSRFEIFGPATGARLWVGPAQLVNSRGDFRIRGVDVRNSWFHEAVGWQRLEAEDSPDDGEDG